MSKRKIRGTFCERILISKKRFGTFRWKKSGRAWILLGCPKGKLTAKGVCRAGFKAYAVLKPSGRCESGEKKIRK